MVKLLPNVAEIRECKVVQVAYVAPMGSQEGPQRKGHNYIKFLFFSSRSSAVE